MVAWAVSNMGGEIPRMEPRLIADNMAASALNCDLQSGALQGLPRLELVVDLTSRPQPVNKAFRVPTPDADHIDYWLGLPSANSSVVMSPLANDTSHRVYWTNPGDGAHFNTFDRLIAGDAHFNLGFTAPAEGALPGVVVDLTGVTLDPTLPLSVRSYCYTFIDEFGLESSPSLPTADVSGAVNAHWYIQDLPPTPPASPAGKNYPAVVSLCLYRTVSGQTSGAQFYRIQTFTYATNPPPTRYDDLALDQDIVNNPVLESASWAPPPDGLDGLAALPGGMLVGFTGNTIHFCEPNRPHAWPAGYDLSVRYPILGFGVWQQQLVVLTEGVPSTGTGATPASFTLSEVQVPEPCVARGSIITDLAGVYYASQNGLVMLNYYGMQNETTTMVTRKEWMSDLDASAIIACRHRSQYLALTGDGAGFIIDYAEPRLAVMPINTQMDATCVWNDAFTGDTYMIADSKVYRWDSVATLPQVFRWRSKEFYGPSPVSLGACQISLDPQVEEVLPPLPVVDNPDPTLALPAGVNALFRLYAHGNLMLEKPLTETRSIFRLPSGFKAFDWQFEIVSRVKVHSVELASTNKELKGV